MNMKKWAILGGVGLVVIIAVVVILSMGGDEKTTYATRPEAPKGPDPNIARIAEFARQAEDYEAKGEVKDALFALTQLEKLAPGDPRIAAARPRLTEKLKRLEAWQSAHQKAEVERKDALRTNTLAGWQKVVDLSTEAEKLAPSEKQQTLSRSLLTVSKQHRDWAQARDEERKGNFAAALDLVAQALAAPDPPSDLAAYKATLEKRKRKQEFDRAASEARKEAVAAKAYDLWMKAKPLAEEEKDVAEVDAKLHALKVAVDPAERDRRYAESVKAGEVALKGGDLDAAEKAFKEAQRLKVTELAPGQALTRVAAARTQKSYEGAVSEARAAEEKKQWADAIDAYDRAIKIKVESAVVARRKEIEQTYRPPKIVLVLNEQSGVKMEFVLVKRGSYLMGDAQGSADEKPHEVKVAKDFWMQTTELTQAQWGIVMESKPWMSPSIPHLPVEGVSWDDTQKFFDKFVPIVRDRLPGRTASLPTEAEWEYACRAGTRTKWSFGNDEEKMEVYGWTSASKIKGPQTVAQKAANPWGLFDMHGNVAEWCSDGYGNYGDPPPAETPTFRVYRGGSWNDRPMGCRSSKRERDVPAKSSLFLGFRAVLR
jgi:formylglycine-generating enzyme required for sulfatase activity